jgi:hypothetical protein
MREHLGLGVLSISFTALLACSSASTGAPTVLSTGAPTSGSDAGGAAMLSGHDANPDGVPYPTPSGGYGRNARSGTTPGSVIANFKFRGYLNGDMSQGLQTIALADYYDPCGKRYKMVHLGVAGLWCEACSEETDALVGAKAQLTSKKVVVLQAVDDGAMENVPATVNDLNNWVMAHKANFTVMLDPGLQNLAGFFNPEAIPWNSDLDPRTMEILDDGVGWSGDVNSEVQTGLSAIPSTPSYPVPACP